MKSREVEEMSGARRFAIRVILGCAMGLGVLFSLGIVDRRASSSRPQRVLAIESTRASEASAVAAQADTDNRESLPGHPELNLQLD